MRDDEHFIKLGASHAAAGMPRYKFQDPHLQKVYDKGYDLHDASDDFREAVRSHCRRCGTVMYNSLERLCQGCR